MRRTKHEIRVAIEMAVQPLFNLPASVPQKGQLMEEFVANFTFAGRFLFRLK